MRELYEKLIVEGEAGIDRLIVERTQESVTLDFKEKSNASTGALDKDDRKVFAKALSAFSNSAGGLVVFGVEARKVDDVDCAQVAKPISDIQRFMSEMTVASGQLLQPRHDGIEVSLIPSAKQAGAGYLLVLVQRSERRPHRSEAAGQKQYFKRAGDSSFEMEHYDIEDAFRCTAAADLSMAIVKTENTANNMRTIRIEFHIKNEGFTSAEEVYCHLIRYTGCTLPTPLDQYRVHGGFDLLSRRQNVVLNPLLTERLQAIFINLPGTNTTNDIELDIQCRFGCKNSRPINASFKGKLSELVSPETVLRIV